MNFDAPDPMVNPARQMTSRLNGEIKMVKNRRQQSENRSGFTLLELLLVLAILVAIMGIAVPSFESMVGSRRLPNSVDQLRNDFMAARVTAMRTGQAQVLQATLLGSEYTIVPWLGGTEQQDASAGATIMSTSGQVLETQASSTGGSTSSAVQTKDAKELKAGIQFLGVETLVDSRNALAIQQTTGVAPTSGAATSSPTTSGVSSPLLIYPDGSTTTAQIVLVDPNGRRMAIIVRGVTGQTTTIQLPSVDPASLTKAP